MCLFLNDVDKKEYKELKMQVKYYRNTVRHLDKENALYNHNKIMFTEMANKLAHHKWKLKMKNRRIFFSKLNHLLRRV